MGPDDGDDGEWTEASLTLTAGWVRCRGLRDPAFRAWVALEVWASRGETRMPTGAELAAACGWLRKDGTPKAGKANRALANLGEGVIATPMVFTETDGTERKMFGIERTSDDAGGYYLSGWGDYDGPGDWKECPLPDPAPAPGIHQAPAVAGGRPWFLKTQRPINAWQGIDGSRVIQVADHESQAHDRLR